jgi:putative selenate reductase FAD-binding subunit
MQNREYYIPDDIEEALSLKAEGGGESAFLAGGTHLNWAPVKAKYSTLIDLKKIVPSTVEISRSWIRIGARITLQELADNPKVPEPLREGALFVASRQVRNVATLGGNIAARRTDSNLIPALIALKALIQLGKGEEMSVEEWVGSRREDLILQILIPDDFGYVHTRRVSRSANAYPVICAAVSLDREPRIVLGSSYPAGTRLSKTEAALKSNPVLNRDDIEALVKSEVDPPEDIHGSREFKTYLTAVTVADMVEQCRKGGV